jgi:hypothetical protein
MRVIVPEDMTRPPGTAARRSDGAPQLGQTATYQTGRPRPAGTRIAAARGRVRGRISCRPSCHADLACIAQLPHGRESGTL